MPSSTAIGNSPRSDRRLTRGSVSDAADDAWEEHPHEADEDEVHEDPERADHQDVGPHARRCPPTARVRAGCRSRSAARVSRPRRRSPAPSPMRAAHPPASQRPLTGRMILRASRAARAGGKRDIAEPRWDAACATGRIHQHRPEPGVGAEDDLGLVPVPQIRIAIGISAMTGSERKRSTVETGPRRHRPIQRHQRCRSIPPVTTASSHAIRRTSPCG